jgi:type IX secretion system PorP/SprF family membrane protein
MKIKFLLLLILTGCISYAQQDAQYTQYMYNTGNINPGYAGSRGCLSILGMHRSQWVGLEGAPKTNTLTINTPLNISHSLGLGVSVVNDILGPSQENNVAIDLNYSIRTSDNFKLALGLKGSANMLSVDFTKLTYRGGSNVPNDVLNANNLENKIFPNVGAGLYWYSDKTYVGLSMPFILQYKYYDQTRMSVASERMHTYFLAGHVFKLSDSFDFKPATLVKAVPGAPLQVDISGNFWYKQKLSLGVAYRLDAAVSALAGFQISDSWMIGYAYDRDVTRLGNFNSGSHEIFLRYELFNKLNKTVSPRFF